MEGRVQSGFYLGELTGQWPRHQEALDSVTRVIEHQVCHWTGSDRELSEKVGPARAKA